MNLSKFIIDIPDFPKPGVMFKDISPMLFSPKAFGFAIDSMIDICSDIDYDCIGAFDARGFLFGPSIMHKTGKPFFMIRKSGKLPGKTASCSYDLEYGSATIEMISTEKLSGKRILLVDDVLATGGTAAAGGKLVEKTGNSLAGFCFLIELSGLEGREILNEAPTKSLLKY